MSGGRKKQDATTKTATSTGRLKSGGGSRSRQVVDSPPNTQKGRTAAAEEADDACA